MKALARVLLVLGLAAGIGSEANAQTCSSNKARGKQVAKHRTSQHSKLAMSKSHKGSKCLCSVKHGTGRSSSLSRSTGTSGGGIGTMRSGTYSGYRSSTDSMGTMYNGSMNGTMDNGSMNGTNGSQN